MFRALLVVLFIALGLGIAWLSGWIKPDALASQRIASQRVDSDFINYQRIYFEAAVLRAGERFAEGRDAFVKAFAQDGRLALCGFTVVPDGPIAQRTRAWLDNGRAEIAGHRLRADFVTVQRPGFIPTDAEAGCMQSELPWREEYAGATIKLTGIPLRDVP